MTRHQKLAALLLSFLICNPGFAQLVGEDFEIAKSTLDSGGSISEGGEFIVTGTIGQHDAAEGLSAGGPFLLEGGFWAKALDVIFKDSFENEQH